MPRSFPDATVILRAAVKYLEDELMPTLEGYHRFKTRVTINAVNIVRRELEMRDSQEASERIRLAALLGHDGDVERLSLELSERIREGSISIDDPALRAHIRQSLSDALEVNNPKWLRR